MIRFFALVQKWEPRLRRPSFTVRFHWSWVAAGLGLAVVLYYLVGAWMLNVIDDNPDFAAPPTSPRQSRAVALAAKLIRREVDIHGWTTNDPFFEPGSLLRDMPPYQQGIIAAVDRFTSSLAAREVEPGINPPDLPLAAGLLKYPGTVWRFNFNVSLLPTTTAEKQYRRAAVALEGYSGHLDVSQLTFDRHGEILVGLLGDVAADLDEANAGIEAHLTEGRRDDAGRLFQTTKGRLYAYFLLLRETGMDFDQVISESGQGRAWAKMMDALQAGALLAPPMVIDAAPDSAFLPNHLAVQGYYLLIARQRLNDLRAALSK